jgi:hypothetical protein
MRAFSTSARMCFATSSKISGTFIRAKLPFLLAFYFSFSWLVFPSRRERRVGPSLRASAEHLFECARGASTALSFTSSPLRGRCSYPAGVAGLVPHCARSASTFLSCALCEQNGSPRPPPPSPFF